MGKWIGFGRMECFSGDCRILHKIESLIKICRDHIVRSLAKVVRDLGFWHRGVVPRGLRMPQEQKLTHVDTHSATTGASCPPPWCSKLVTPIFRVAMVEVR